MNTKCQVVLPNDVARMVKSIQVYHARGKASLQLPSTISIEHQATELRWSDTKLRKARQFADPLEGFSPERLKVLCQHLREHKPQFGVAHIGLLVTVPWPGREQLLEKCIENNWSMRELREEVKRLSAPRNKGGRRRQVDPDNVLVILETEATTLKRLYAAIRWSRDGQPPILGTLSQEVSSRLEVAISAVKKLRFAVSAELATTRV